MVLFQYKCLPYLLLNSSRHEVSGRGLGMEVCIIFEIVTSVLLHIKSFCVFLNTALQPFPVLCMHYIGCTVAMTSNKFANRVM